MTRGRNAWGPWLERSGAPLEEASSPIVLAPMQGVTDPPMRALLAEVGGFTWAVSEFIRVTDQIPPDSVLFKLVPELRTAGLASGCLPVQPQILGGSPVRVAATAKRCVALGANAIDLNFGCPAPTVNRHDGGASLLREPKRLGEIVAACVDAVGSNIPVSAKLRLGWADEDEIFNTAHEADRAGARWLTIHARTRAQNYAPPSHFENFRALQGQISCPIVANGDLFTTSACAQSIETTGIHALMLGRGAVADPYLAHRLKSKMQGRESSFRELPPAFEIPVSLFSRLLELSDQTGSKRHRAGRLKQWIRMRHQVQPCGLYGAIKQMPCPEMILQEIATVRLSRR